jgi:hypothetical protein
MMFVVTCAAPPAALPIVRLASAPPGRSPA